MYNYLYLIQDNRDIGSNVYKIGKTTQLPSDRFKGYAKGTYPIRISQVDNCHQREYELIDLFKKRYELYRGREYFEGNLNDMIKEFNNLCNDCINMNDNNELLENELYYNQKIKDHQSKFNLSDEEAHRNYTCDLCKKEYDYKKYFIFLDHTRQCFKKEAKWDYIFKKQLIIYIVKNTYLSFQKITEIYKLLSLSYRDIRNILDSLTLTNFEKVNKLCLSII
jgi:hypothetical protein